MSFITDYIIKGIPRKELIYIKLNVNFCSMLLNKQYELKMTDNEFADVLGISKRKLNKLKSGDIDPTLSLISEICDRLKMDVELVFEED